MGHVNVKQERHRGTREFWGCRRRAPRRGGGVNRENEPWPLHLRCARRGPPFSCCARRAPRVNRRRARPKVNQERCGPDGKQELWAKFHDRRGKIEKLGTRRNHCLCLATHTAHQCFRARRLLLFRHCPSSLNLPLRYYVRTSSLSSARIPPPVRPSTPPIPLPLLPCCGFVSALITPPTLQSIHPLRSIFIPKYFLYLSHLR